MGWGGWGVVGKNIETTFIYLLIYFEIFELENKLKYTGGNIIKRHIQIIKLHIS